MISALTGVLTQVDEDRVHVRVGPVTCETLVPASDVPLLQAGVGAEVTFHTLFYIEGDSSGGNMEPRLIGFLRAEDKPRQLAAARRMGLSIPDTLVTNSFGAAQAFLAEGPMVAKPLRHALIDDGEVGSVIFTSRVAELGAGDAEAVRRAPLILQREILKRSDVRVVVIDDAIFATRILSQAHDETQVDWRKGVRLDLAHEAMDLPTDLALACIAVTRDLGLRFAAIDLVEDEDGRFWFLEANPNGQWAWIEQRTGAPVTTAIVDALAGGRVE